MKKVKAGLKDRNIITHEELQTMHKIELELNRRPLTFLYSNPNDTVLAPNHLLYGRQLNLKSFPLKNCNIFKVGIVYSFMPSWDSIKRIADVHYVAGENTLEIWRPIIKTLPHRI